MTLITRIHFARHGVEQIVTGKEIDVTDLKVGDVTTGITEAEAHLERLTGLKVKIVTSAS